jgi:protein-tyrosine phosphatase
MNPMRKGLNAIRKVAGSFVSRYRRNQDAKLHPDRHRAVKQRLLEMPRPRSIAVICHANICRSPYMEALLKRSLPDVNVFSAGFVGAGREVPGHSTTLAARNGLDLSAHRSRLLSRDLLAGADLVVVMEPRQADVLVRGFGVVDELIVVAGDLDPLPGNARTIHDPWGQSLEAFEDSFARLERCASSLVRILKGTQPRDAAASGGVPPVAQSGRERLGSVD